MAQRLLARFDTNEVKEELYSKGIWITHLVYIDNVKEFVNINTKAPEQYQQ